MDETRTISIPEQKPLPGWELSFPLILTPKSEHTDRPLTGWLEWISRNRTKLREELTRHGALYFRDFPLSSPTDFNDFVEAFGLENFPYVGGAATRRVVVGNVFTSNEAPSESNIPFHHEMSQVPDNPDVLFFYCDVAPGCGGETPLVLSHLAHQLISQRAPQFIERLDREGVRYIRVAPENDDPSSAIGRSWRSTFGGAVDRAEAEARARAQGTNIEWLEDGSARTISRCLPATRLDERTGRNTWFNSIIAAYSGWNDARNEGKKSVVFGGSVPKHNNSVSCDVIRAAGRHDVMPLGEFMPAEAMQIVDDVMNELAVAVQWRRGDVIMIDNKLVLHARRPFTPPRTILACLCRDQRD